MKFKYLLGLLITSSLMASMLIQAAGPSSVENELAKQEKYASELMASINSGKYSGKQLVALKILHQKILDFPIPTQAELDARYEKDQEGKKLAKIDRDNKRMGILPMNADRMENNADAIDRNSRSEQRGGSSNTPD